MKNPMQVKFFFMVLIFLGFFFIPAHPAHAAVTVNSGHTTSYDTSGQTNHVINTPAHSVGDVIYLFAVIDGSFTMTPPSGFTAVPNKGAK